MSRRGSGFGVRRGAILAVSLLVLAAGTAWAVTAGEIRDGGRRVAAELARLGAQPGLAAERRLVGELGPLVLGFIDLGDREARAGRSGAALKPAFEAVHTPLDSIYTRVSGELERKARAVMDVDGDLEALYETPEWQEAQQVAAHALYFRNWLNYYGARLYDGERRKTLLEQAERGFSEFAVGDRRSDLLTESLLGRALCHLELGNYEWATRDLRIVLDEPSVSSERKQKARLALLETYVRAGNAGEALRYSKELLAGGGLSSGEQAIVRFYRLEVLLDRIPKESGRQADLDRAEASGLMDRLRRHGPGWAEKVDALMATRIDDPAKWAGEARGVKDKWQLARLLLQQQNFDAAAPLLADVVSAEGEEAKPYRAEASYWLGVARFKAEDYDAAAKRLTEALSDPEADYAPEAAYLRFKSLESLMAKEPTPQLTTRYREAIEGYLQRFPDHEHAFEARYRFGELLQAEGDFAAAVAQYAAVAGDPAIELRAAFGRIQSRFEQLKTETAPDAREALLAAIGEDFERFWKLAEKVDVTKSENDLRSVVAKATLLQAIQLSLDGGPQEGRVVEVLAGFEEKFPHQTELLPQAVRVRLTALRELGRFADARQQVTAHGDLLRDPSQHEAIERLAGTYARAAGRAKGEGNEADADAARRVALALYELSGDDAEDGRRALTVARLYEATGDLDEAARAYREILDRNARSLAALAGLARVEEERNDLAAAREQWERYTAIARPGDAPWYRGNYHQARLALAGGDAERSCKILEDLRPAMPGLSDTELREQLSALYDKACG